MKLACLTSVSGKLFTKGDPILINPERVGGIRYLMSSVAADGDLVSTINIEPSVIMCAGEVRDPPVAYSIPNDRYVVLLVDGREIYVRESLEVVLERLGVVSVNPHVPRKYGCYLNPDTQEAINLESWD